MSERLSYINILVWKSQDTVTDAETFEEKLEKADIEEDLGYDVEELIKERLEKVGLDCDEDGIYFLFNRS
ncbi:MAG: hypothetical protein ACXABY_02535 [Candidatus Thorarchaeota archaeon]|jgi:hypothetical protein